MSGESKEVEQPTSAGEAKHDADDMNTGDSEQTGEQAHGPDDGEDQLNTTSQSQTKKKKGKAKKLKEAITGSSAKNEPSSLSNRKIGEIDKATLEKVLEGNPALKSQAAAMSPIQLSELMKTMSVGDLLTGSSLGGKNRKDMASHAFWKTQPVMTFDEMAERKIAEGPIKNVVIEEVPKEPPELRIDGFEWVTIDLEDERQLEEVYDLLCNHYVEDDEAMFRFAYSKSFLNWALKAPGWRKEWHVGIRVGEKKRLCAFISGIPVELRVRETVLKCSEINYLAIHKKLRNKRLAPILIKEITRRCNLVGIFQAIYTAGVMLPTPVSTCRYYHRSLDWEKLFDLGFSPMPHGSTRQRQVLKYRLPTATTTPGLRILERKDLDAVLDLLKRYLERFNLAQVFKREEVEHWLLHDPERAPDQVVWSYVVEDADKGKITDFFSFYRLESTALASKKNELIRAAYLFYYATETAFSRSKSDLKARLNQLMHDALILAKKVSSLKPLSHALTDQLRLSHSRCSRRSHILCRPISTYSTPFHCSRIHFSSRSKNTARETGCCTIIFTTTGRHL